MANKTSAHSRPALLTVTGSTIVHPMLSVPTPIVPPVAARIWYDFGNAHASDAGILATLSVNGSPVLTLSAQKDQRGTIQNKGEITATMRQGTNTVRFQTLVIGKIGPAEFKTRAGIVLTAQGRDIVDVAYTKIDEGLMNVDQTWEFTLP